jgi:hypothetical protein
MGVHAAGTQQGLSYRLAPLQGTRAAVLTALISRAPAAHVEIQTLQSTIWQIGGGMAYSQMSRPSQELIDRLIPEYRNQLNEDFVASLQKQIQILNRMPATRAVGTELEKLVQTYQRVQQSLSQNADNYEALARQFVNVIPGTAPEAGPTSWSRLNARVYARLTGGRIYGQFGNVEVRVLPSGNTGSESPNHRPSLLNTAFRAGRGFPQSSSTGDLAEVPLGPIIAYPNNNPGMQGLAGVLEGGNQMSASQARLVMKLEIVNMQLQQIQTDLMWIDCNATVQSAADAVAYIVQAVGAGLTPNEQQLIQWEAVVYDVAEAIGNLDPVSLADTVLVTSIMQAAGLNCDRYNAAKAIIQAARAYVASHPRTFPSSGPFTSHTIVPGSIGYAPGLLSFSVPDGPGTQPGPVQVKLSFVPCQQDPVCQQSATTSTNTLPTATAVAAEPGQTGANTNGAQSNSRVTLSVSPSATTAGGQAVVFGFVQDSNGKSLAGAVVELTASAGGVTTSPSRLTTDANGAFSAPFTAPPTPGVVTFRVTVSGSAPPIVATATLSVKPTADKPSIATPQEDPNSPQKRAPSAIARKSGIRSVDFQNFDYSSNCLEENGPLQIIHVTQGRANNDDGDFLADKPVFGDLKGDGQEEAVVVLSCHPADMSPNVVSSKIFIFEMSASGPNVLAKLPASNWGDRRVESTKVANKYLEVSYTDGECNACKDWIVTVRFHWNGSQFVRTGQTHKPYKTSSSIWKRADSLSWVSFTAASGRRAEN